MAVLAGGASPSPAPMIAPGTVFATRNAGGEEANRTPGSERNHVALMARGGYVLEAQADPIGKVIAVPVATFLARYPDVQAFRLVDDAMGLQWADNATKQLGEPYRRLAANCVSLLRTSFPGKPQRWKRPDHVIAGATMIGRKLVADEDFTPPDDPWAGMTTDPKVVQGLK